MMVRASDITFPSPQQDGLLRRYRLEINGTVQGVGFRPFFYRQAQLHGLTGFVANTGHGVVAEIQGASDQIDAFLENLHHTSPANAVIREIAITGIVPAAEHAFEIRASTRHENVTTPILPDLATCDVCLREIFDPDDRRYLYPFANCTQCGPRYSIIIDLPYDRANTAMHDFGMCGACQAEYDDPQNRRFHAEPNACPDCGPRLILLNTNGRSQATQHDALRLASDAIREGQILALKGIGGFQLIADARSSSVVTRLRKRKQRPSKPFAVMCPDFDFIERLCRVSATEAQLLQGCERPIVLLRRRLDAAIIATSVAPDNPWLGVMLPYSPLHHVLLSELAFPVVATSGNLSDEPIATENSEALERLSNIADCFLVHDRAIARPVDDSVVRVIRNRPQILRRARGYAPAPVRMQKDAMEPDTLALGGYLKSALACSRQDQAILGQHIGDLDNPDSRDVYDAAVDDLLRLNGIGLQAIACDMHPDYYSTQRAEQLSASQGVPLHRVQHHLAHVAAGMAEHQLDPPVLGIAWDGSGYGTDHTIWGGEFILVTNTYWSRVARLRSFRLPGGVSAIREPRRSAYGVLHAIAGDAALAMEHLPPVADFSMQERRTLAAMLAKGINSPLTSSAGRLFDVAAALLGFCQTTSYEGEAACALEWAAERTSTDRCYEMPVTADGNGVLVIDWEPLIKSLLADYLGGVAVDELALAFHTTLVKAITDIVTRLGTTTILLTGGCFQNALLTNMSVSALNNRGCQTYWHERVPPGDGGLALGQLFWAARLPERGVQSCV